MRSCAASGRPVISMESSPTVTTTLRCRSLAPFLDQGDQDLGRRAGDGGGGGGPESHLTHARTLTAWFGGPVGVMEADDEIVCPVQGVVQVPGETLLPECVAARGHDECPRRSPVAHVLLLAFAHLLVRSVQRLWREGVRR